jgi:hypothetical protein
MLHGTEHSHGHVLQQLVSLLLPCLLPLLPQPEWNTSKIFPIAPNSTAESAPDLILTLAFSEGNNDAAQDVGRVQLPMGYLKVTRYDAVHRTCAPLSLCLSVSLSVCLSVSLSLSLCLSLWRRMFISTTAVMHAMTKYIL